MNRYRELERQATVQDEARRNKQKREETIMQNPVRQEIASTLKAARAIERKYGLHATARARNEDARYAATVELYRNGIRWGTHDPHTECPSHERAIARKGE